MFWNYSKITFVKTAQTLHVQEFGLSKRRQFEPSNSFLYKNVFAASRVRLYFFAPANTEPGAFFGYAEFPLPEKRRTSGFSKSLKNRAKVQGDSFLRVKITGVSHSSSISMNGPNQWTLDSVRVRSK